MKRKNFRGSWSAILTLLLLFSAASSKAETGKGLKDSNPTIRESLVMPVTPQDGRTIKGVIKDATGETIIGANISVPGTTNGTVTNENGEFSLNVPTGATLKITYVGYKDVTIKITNQQTLNIVLEDNSQAMGEVVVIGFGSQKKVNLTGAVSTVKAEALAERPVTNVSQALQGLVPGLNFSISNGGGELDNTMKFNIRGSGSIGSGSAAAPLVLIDGMEGDMNTINPQDIENISVLKDAAASSIYGSRAPFGVILITTKSGKSGKVTINYNNNIRFSDPLKVPEMMNSYDFARYYNAAGANGGTSATFSQEMLDRIVAYQTGELKDGTKADSNGNWQYYTGSNANTDWFQEHYRHWAPSHEHNISVSGGNEKINYMVSGNFMDQRGMLRHSDDSYKRFSLNAKIGAELTKYIHMNYTSRWVRNDYDKSYYQNALFFHNIARRWPTVPVTDPNGHWPEQSEIVQLENGGRDNKSNDYLTQQLQLVIEPIKNWKITAEGNFRTENMNREYAVLPVFVYNAANEPRPMKFDEGHLPGITEARKESSARNYYSMNFFTDYFYQTDNGHYFKAMVGFNAELNKFSNLWASRQGLISSDVPFISTSTENMKNSAGKNEWSTAGFFGRLNYNYKDRYMAEVNMRYDGTSRFLDDGRWGFFPSFSAGWNVARESFWEDWSEYVNELKIRGSWGELGNQNTTDIYPFFPAMSIGAGNGDWLIDGKQPTTAGIPGLVSSLMTWETVRSWNIGLDVGALRNRLTASFDYFKRQTLDMVGPAPELPATLGTDVPKINNADMESYGFELELAWRDRIGKVNYGVKAVLSDAQQKITRYPNENMKFSNWYSGKMVGEIWGYTTVGIAKSQEEMDAHLANVDQGALGSKWAAGDIMYADINHDNKINEGAGQVGDSGDKKVIGNDTPRYNYGITLDASWNGIDISAFFQGVGKRDFEVGGMYFWGAMGDMWGSTGFVDHLDYFRPEGDEMGANLNAYYPRPLFGADAGRNHNTQTRYLQNAAYLRLKNLQIGYTFPKQWMNKINIQSLRLYVSGDNLFTVTKMAGMFDPETIRGRANWDLNGTDAASNSVDQMGKVYPLSRVISFGINVNF